MSAPRERSPAPWMHIDEAKRRARAGLPIEPTRELVHALNAVRERVQQRTPAWYLLNRATREAMDLADAEEKAAASAVQAFARWK